ncbi:MAG TPA: metallophosphoesterase family protein [Bacteroidota bacterium]|nr:metallophosphoesterase family protein [Bacteroidota bacterium]
MKFAVISDIHGNLEALTKAFELIDEKKVGEVLCLGDIIGYGANPNECVSFLRERGVRSLIGNHDQAVVDPEKAGTFNELAGRAIEWTARTLTPDNLEYLSNLPYLFVEHDFTFVHSSPENPEEWNYILSPFDALEAFRHFSSPICWVGHSHRSGVFCEDMKTQRVERGKRFIINVGSIGQPRNRDSRLSFGVFDTDGWEYEHIVSPYDVQRARQKILDAGLPAFLGDRLLYGA